MQDWDDLRFVLAIARAGTLAGAARGLAVNESTVARRLARAEARLAARLFERRRGRLEPTSAGRAMIASAEAMELAAESAVGRLSGSDRRTAGSVRVTAVPLLANRLLVPALPALFAAHPALGVELIADPENLSLIDREADLALRLARPTQEPRVVARRIADLAYAAYARADLATEVLPWIGYEPAMAELAPARWLAARIAESGAESGLRVRDAETALQALRSGLGKSLLPSAIGDREAGLRRVEASAEPLAREIWLLVHPELRDLARIRAVADWLVETFAVLPQVSSEPESGPSKKTDSCSANPSER